MITCINCEHGHHCPYTGKVDDLHHALLFVWEDMPKSKGSFHSFSRRFEAKDASAFKEITEIIRKLYDIKIDFEFDYDGYVGPPVGVKKCEGYKKLNIHNLPKPGKKQAQRQTKRPGKQQTLFD